MRKWIPVLIAILFSASATGAPQPDNAPMLDGAVFRHQVIDDRDNEVDASMTLEFEGTRGILSVWSRGAVMRQEGRKGTRKYICRLQGLRCVIGPLLEYQISPDGETATPIIRRTDGKVMEEMVTRLHRVR
jgi:hypothetical protein